MTGVALLVTVAGFMAFAWGREANPAAGRLWHLANQTALFLLFFALAAGLLRAWRRSPRPGPGFYLLALGVILVDLWTFGSRTVQPVEVQESATWHVVAQAVDDPAAARVLPWGLNDFDQNGGMSLGLRSVFGYDPLILQRYEAFITSWPDPRARTYDLLNARYLVTLAPLEPSDEADAPRLLLEQSGVYVYERPGALPRAWVVPQVERVEDGAALARIHEPGFDPHATALVDSEFACTPASPEAGEAQILSDAQNRIEVQVRGGGGLLVLSELDYPGWQAEVDGDPAQLVRADYLLRALCVPAGEHRVELVYDPPLLKVGLAVTGLALLWVAGIALWRRIERQRR